MILYNGPKEGLHLIINVFYLVYDHKKIIHFTFFIKVLEIMYF